jgi:hypothetical protein
MEGNNSSACLMISEYQHIINFIKKSLASSTQPEFKTMLAAMLKKTKPYLNEAMRCDSVLIATILNPSFRLSIFKVLFPSHYKHAHDLIHKLFKTRNAQVNIALSSLPDGSDALIGTKSKATNLD